jgi:hypothetical protein
MSKVAITGNASGTGVFTVASPNSNVDRVLTLPDESGTVLTTEGVPTSAMPAGSVLQVISVTKTDFFSTASSSYVDVTGVSATITPRSTLSKILVTITGGCASSGSPNGFGYGVILRGSTQIGIGDSRGPAQRTTMDLAFGNPAAIVEIAKPFAVTLLDSPATTSATTYKLQVRSTVNSLGIGGSWSTSDGNRSNLPTIITLMEIAG